VDDNPRGSIRNAMSWLVGFVLLSTLGLAITSVETAIWRWLRHVASVPLTIALVVGAAVGLSSVAAWRFGRLRGEAVGEVLYRAAFALRMIPYRLWELFMLGHPGNGRRNRRYPSVGEFVLADGKRAGGPQHDFGIGWHERRTRDAHRVTWIEPTGELVAVRLGSEGDQQVEVLATIRSEAEVERRLADSDYA